MARPSPSGNELIAFSVAMIFYSTLAVFLRLLIRSRTKAPYGADDWWIIFSLLVYYVYMALQIWGVVAGGIGSSLITLPYPELVLFFKILYISLPFSVTTTAAAKISILYLYRRLFSTQSFRRNSFVVGIFVVCYWIASLVGSFLQCQPVHAAWDIAVPAKCIDFAAFFLGTELSNCVLDVIMLCLPIGIIRTLHLPRRQKFQLGIIFLMGGLVLLAGITRMAVIYRAGSRIPSIFGDLIWATIENGLAIICACLPTYRPLLPKKFGFGSKFSGWYASFLRFTQIRRESSSKPSVFSEDSRSKAPRTHKRYNQIGFSATDNIYLTEAVGGAGGESWSINSRDHTHNGIMVKDTVEVV